MESKEEVKAAAVKFGKLQGEAETEGKEKHADILETTTDLLTDGNVSGQQYRYESSHFQAIKCRCS